MSCACGCGAPVKPGRRFKHGHSYDRMRVRRKALAQSRNALYARRGLEKLGLEPHA